MHSCERALVLTTLNAFVVLPHRTIWRSPLTAARNWAYRLSAAEHRLPVTLATVPCQILALVVGDVLHHDWSVHWVVPLPWPHATVRSSDRSTANRPTPLSTFRRSLQDSWRRVFAPQADGGFLACPNGQASLRHSPYAHHGVRLAWFERTEANTGDNHDIRPDSDALARSDTTMPTLRIRRAVLALD